MSNDSSGEPGVNLGRMIAAERNALAGLQSAKQANDLASSLLVRVMKLENELLILRDDNNRMRIEAIVRGAGTGPTSRR